MSSRAPEGSGDRLEAPELRLFPEQDHLVLQVDNLSKRYSLPGRAERPNSPRTLELFRGLSFSVARGTIVAIVGQSGVGKSTLLHLLGALDRPSEGEIWIAGTQLSRLSGAEAARFRNRDVGYVWQFHYLLPEFTALENVAMPLLAKGLAAKTAGKLAAGWLERVGLADRASNRAGELSGGEQQRVSLARALITEPKLLLADEPTGDLDGKTADAIFDLIVELHRERALTTVLVTHNMPLARRCHRVVRLTHDGMNEEAAAALPPNVQ